LELYELRPDAASCAQVIENDGDCSEGHVFGLHAQNYVVDRRVVYVGSLSMNLRSCLLNAESGLVIDNSELARRIARDIEANMKPANSWRPMLDEDGHLRWLEQDEAGAEETVSDREPRVGWSRRMRSNAISLLPLEKYL
jgi:putative cardiolipin synthase